MATATSSATSRISPALATLILLIALNLLNYIDRYILPGELSLIQNEFHATREQMGALTTAMFFVYMFAAPLTGWLGDRYRRKPLIIGGAILWSLATLSTAWVHSYWTLYLRHAIVGIGEASFGIFAPAVIADFYPERDRNRILSIFYVAIPVGAALGYMAGGQMGSAWGWRQPFFICAIPGLIVAVLYGFFGHEPVRGAQDHIQADNRPHNLRRTLSQSRLPHRNVWTGHADLCHGRHLQLGPRISPRPHRPLRRQSQPGRRCQHGNRRHPRHRHRRLDRATLAPHQSPRPLPAQFLERRISRCHSASCSSSAQRAGPSPRSSLAEFFLFLNTGPLNTAIVNSVSAPVRATAVSVNLFCIHFFGDTFSPQIIGRIADHSNLRIGLGATLVFLVLSCIILLVGSRFAPQLEDSPL